MSEINDSIVSLLTSGVIVTPVTSVVALEVMIDEYFLLCVGSDLVNFSLGPQGDGKYVLASHKRYYQLDILVLTR
jgi:hypothetical protein